MFLLALNKIVQTVLVVNNELAFLVANQSPVKWYTVVLEEKEERRKRKRNYLKPVHGSPLTTAYEQLAAARARSQQHFIAFLL